MSIHISAEENASLAELQHTPIDTVLNIIDQGLVHLPSYRELYYRWERQQWRAQDIDFVPDRIQWELMPDEEQEEHLYSIASFFQGEASVTDALAPYVIAMPEEEMRIYVTTQLVDESRHTIFFARFFSEVLGIDEGLLEESLAFARQYMNVQMRYILIDALMEMADRIRCQPGNLHQLIEGVTLYHVIIEGTMALAGQRNLLETYRQDNLFPAFRSGFTAVARDESRHVIFGVKFLRDMLKRDPEHAHVVRAALEKYAPPALAALRPPDDVIPSMLAMNLDPWTTQRYGLESLRKKLKVIGLSMELPAVPGFEDVLSKSQ
ncbi:MAG TPA: ribonucleotide-diphosphate reductase subunit beta [Ktedonobacteraceae bacterium]|nr:ribonucleotide-diphosphate reductase subunit beta [Ktedonobacteraceae bacterium]